MQSSIRTAVRTLALTALTAAVAGAQGRSPEEILARYTKAIDPQGKIATVEGVKTVATMEMPAAGMNAKVTAYQRRPNQMVSVIELAGLGEMKQGYDGTTAWSVNPMQGPRILTAEEAKELIDGADFKAMGRDASLFSSVEAAGEATVEGEATDCIKLTWKNTSRVTTECFSRASGLLLEMRATQVSPQGEISVTSRYYDYKDVGGLVMAHRVENSLMGMQQTIKLSEVVVGPVEASVFELPAEIKALKKP